MTKKYDSTVARIAGNIASGIIRYEGFTPEVIAQVTVNVARLIVAECERTEPPPSTNAVDPVVQSGQEGPTRA